MSRAIDGLKEEHELILSLLGVLDRFCEDVGSGFAPPLPGVRALVELLKDLADNVHHQKEERLLFPALAATRAGQRGGCIPGLVSEHLLGRDLAREMSLALSSGPDYLTFAHAARSYGSLLRGHIRREDNDLFPTSEAELDAPRLSTLDESFEEYERELPEPLGRRQIRERAAALRARHAK